MPKQRLILRTGDREALQAVKKWIEAEPGEMPSLKLLCKKSGLNTDKLKKGFKVLYGVSPGKFHFQLKMEKAKQLLMHTEYSVTEIAWILGYHHVPGFCASFRKLTGCSPLQFRILSTSGK